MKIINAFIEIGQDGTYSIYTDDMRLDYAINGQGATVEEAKADFMSVYEGMKALYAEEGKSFEEVEFEFKSDVVSYLRYYSTIFTLVGMSRLTGINKGQLSHYINGASRPTEKTKKRIQCAMSDFARNLSRNTVLM